MAKIVTFGEIMLRLSPPGFERLLQSPSLQATFGGAEANVAVGLAHFGHESHYVTRVPANPIGDAALRALMAEGVRLDHVQRGGDRLGIYFVETGASQRPSKVVYDRAHAAFAHLAPESVPWPSILEGAAWFHGTGITPALGAAPADALRDAFEAARRAGVATSLDLNFRSKLWRAEEARAALCPLVPLANLVIGNDEVFTSILGMTAPDAEGAARAVSETFGVARVAVTQRDGTSASENGWGALLFEASSGACHVSARYRVRLVDRIGGGDAFAAGLLHAFLRGDDGAGALAFAVAAGALKQTIPGDFNRVSEAEIDQLVAGDAGARVQR